MPSLELGHQMRMTMTQREISEKFGDGTKSFRCDLENSPLETVGIVFRETSRSAASRKTQENTVKRLLELIILCLANNEPINGYWITQFVRWNFNVWLSSGTTYSTLQGLEKKGLLELLSGRKIKYYKIPVKGRETLEIMSLTLNQIKKVVDASKTREPKFQIDLK